MERLLPGWRSAEWDENALFFTAVPGNPATSVFVCKVNACSTHVAHNGGRCSACRRTRSARGNPSNFDETYVPDSARRRPNVSDGPLPGVSQFSLSGVSLAVRREILYGIQQRDAAGINLVPQHVRRVVAGLPPGLSSLLDLDESFTRGLPADAAGFLNGVLLHVQRARLQFNGGDATSGDVWQSSLVGLTAGRGRKYAAVHGIIDFRPIRQQWLRELVKEYGRTVRPNVLDLRQTLYAASIASTALADRPQSDKPENLSMSDMSAVVDAFRVAKRSDGRDYSTSHRRSLLRLWRTFLEYARQAGMMDHVPGGFALNPRYHSIAAVEASEDDIGRAIPEHVIAQLNAHISLLGTSTTYESGGWTAADFTQMYQVVYRVLRDTGRRPGEVTSLHRDCLEWIDGKPTLIYDNHKRRRHGRRLPISEATAQEIEAWKKELDRLPPVPACEEWLFPSPGQRNRPRRGHLTSAQFCNRIFRDWVDELISDLVDERLDESGAPLAYDRTQIVPYGFRHAYAQRHADAGTRPDVLKELMDHRSLDVTMGYYKVSLSRKQEAVRTVAKLAVDRHGTPQGFGDPLAYEVESVAVPYGGCTEPSNVKAGGGHCRIRFQCAGCDFYRPDPSYLPALEQQVAELRADKEAALAMDAADWVVRNFDDQIRAYAQSADEMRRRLEELPEDERAAVEAASRALRKARSAAAFIPVQSLTTRSAL
ncbi:tyrosine-type recombinase/integrase [Streptomyces europaeiscabiei]|uniref:tyrosine-type recombinase/integrase n=1 Tax=Streptomyces TaxID=1883 RepID=UPI001C4F8C35|nr:MULTISPECIES: tyrosine-type recombinase/integrase [Streptomyces]MDX3634465.1 tyrosine-type recombinase/integrase [Streptomyces europaeiscabiei]MDX3653379.1 tyrosine-type recombinase/integrase [Streptomyces europaeiscabiei]WUD33216.1 tyrosine-type recombinase/integrase [Streptomyces europaeiscabiei]